MIETLKQIVKLLLSSDKIYIIPIILLLLIIALFIIGATISPIPIFMYPVI